MVLLQGCWAATRWREGRCSCCANLRRADRKLFKRAYTRSLRFGTPLSDRAPRRPPETNGGGGWGAREGFRNARNRTGARCNLASEACELQSASKRYEGFVPVGAGGASKWSPASDRHELSRVAATRQAALASVADPDPNLAGDVERSFSRVT